jgi:hypothetical protein
MPRPQNRKQLLEQMEHNFRAMWQEVDSIPAEAHLVAGACEEWSVKDILAHLDAWHEMFLLWEREGSSDREPEMPAPGFTWKQTPELNQAIWERTRHDGYGEVCDRLRSSYERARAVVESYGNEDLFTKRRYRWTGSTSVGSYAVSATSSHYDWARQLVRKYKRSL